MGYIEQGKKEGATLHLGGNAVDAKDGYYIEVSMGLCQRVIRSAKAINPVANYIYRCQTEYEDNVSSMLLDVVFLRRSLIHLINYPGARKYLVRYVFAGKTTSTTRSVYTEFADSLISL